MPIAETITGIIIGYLLGIVLHPSLKDHIFYKYFWSPIDISSDDSLHEDTLKYGVNVDRMFDDTITIYNKTKNTIMIKTIGVKIASSENYMSKGFGIFWDKDRDSLMKNMSANVTSGAEGFLSRRAGFLSSKKDTFPIILEPNGHTKLHFGILAPTEKGKEIKTEISITPEYQYRKPKLKYFVIFRHD